MGSFKKCFQKFHNVIVKVEIVPEIKTNKISSVEITVIIGNALSGAPSWGGSAPSPLQPF